MSRWGQIHGGQSSLLSKRAAYTLNIAMTVVGIGALLILRDPSQAWLLYVYDWTASCLASFTFSAPLLALPDICIWIVSAPAVAECDKRLWGGAEK